mgnify:CR=1 FL=1
MLPLHHVPIIYLKNLEFLKNYPFLCNYTNNLPPPNFSLDGPVQLIYGIDTHNVDELSAADDNTLKGSYGIKTDYSKNKEKDAILSTKSRNVIW